MKGKKKHCPNCHKNIIPVQWACGCVRCPKCTYVFVPCIIAPRLKKVSKGICKQCGKEMWEYVPRKKRNEFNI